MTIIKNKIMHNLFMNLKVYCTYVLAEAEFSVIVFGRKVYELFSRAERDLNLHHDNILFLICYK